MNASAQSFQDMTSTVYTHTPRPIHRIAFAACLAGLSLLPLGGCGGGGGGGGGGDNVLPSAVAQPAGEAIAHALTRFDTTGTQDPDGRIATRSWAYGDGQTGSDDSHIYAKPGAYRATFTVTDDRGGQTSTTFDITVTACSAAGLAAARLSPFPSVCMQTSAGELVMELYPDLAPVTVANFLVHVNEGFYEGTLFHKAERNVAIWGGGCTPGPAAKASTHPPIALESGNGLKNHAYTLAMARGDAPDSATSQFYINLVDNPGLDDTSGQGSDGHTVFGQVIAGNALVDELGKVATQTRNGLALVPVEDVLIRGVLVLP